MKTKSFIMWHRRVGIILLPFLFIQGITGLIVSIMRLGSVYGVPYVRALHHGGEASGEVYRIALGVAILVQGVLGFILWRRLKR